MLKLHKTKCENMDITIIGTSPESHLYGIERFHKNPFHFGIYADFETDIEIDNSSIGYETTEFFKQNPIFNGYHIESELEDVLKSAYYKTTLRYDNVDWFVDEVIKVQNKISFCFKNTMIDIFLTEEDEEDFKITDVCSFCEKEILSDKVRDHCHLRGKYGGPAHSQCNINFTQGKSNTSPLIFYSFTIYDFICILKN